jgi:hypothetical protein
MPDRPPDLDTWVLAGQSNMAGRGWRRDAPSPHDLVWSFSSAGRWERAEEPLHRLWESFTPVHQVLMRTGMRPEDMAVSDAEYARREAESDHKGTGPGLAFGIAMAEALHRPIGLIPCAHGGTSLDQWSPEGRRRGGESLYGAMLERIRRAGGRLRGVLWYQGESDTDSPELAESYGARLDAFLASLRADTGMPDLPFIVVQIGRVLVPSAAPGRIPGWDLVREALATLPQRAPATAVTSAVDLPLCDSIHVSGPGLVRLGARLARLARRLTGEAVLPAGPRVKVIERWSPPDGTPSGLRLRFEGLAGRWIRRDGLAGFTLHASRGVPPIVMNAMVDEAEGDEGILLLLDRPPVPGETLAYGLGADPRCDLVDAADMPLCSFMPRAIPRAG